MSNKFEDLYGNIIDINLLATHNSNGLMSAEDKIKLDNLEERINTLEQQEILLWKGTLNINESVKIEGISKFKRLKLWILNTGYVYVDYRDNGTLGGITFFIYENNLFSGMSYVRVDHINNTITNIASGYYQLSSFPNITIDYLKNPIIEIYGVI